MNRFIFDGDGFLIVETKFGNVVIEQSYGETSVTLVENDFRFHKKNASHIEHKDFMETTIISMVKDE